ncbi:MAG: thioredoxin domain-containing protein [Candidatus Parcubacteria bacterium]|nr:thioredoxin domain-containing protein [Candidatus Parcubacteria bacterium]
MPTDKKKFLISPQKLYFIYFLIFSVIVIVVISYSLVNYYWKEWKMYNFLDQYYKNQSEQAQKKIPAVTRYDPIKGQPDAKVTVFTYTDFTCPSCATAQATLDSLEKIYTSQVRFIFKGLPVTINQETRPSLSASYCAWEQNKFWDYQALLFQNQANLNQATYISLAQNLSLDTEKFQQCLNTNKYGAVLDRNLAEAVNLEVTAVPTIFVNDQKIEGFINYYTLKNIIDSELKKS